MSLIDAIWGMGVTESVLRAEGYYAVAFRSDGYFRTFLADPTKDGHCLTLRDGHAARKARCEMTPPTDRVEAAAASWEPPLTWCPPDDSPFLGSLRGAPMEGSASPAASEASPAASDQRAVTRRYDRMAWIYDTYNAPMELMGTRRRRRRLLDRAYGAVLEVGVGTGKNLKHYPQGPSITGADISSAMLVRARRRATNLKRHICLLEADVHRLPFSDDEFDTTVATCVFCSVADPVTALSELGRVTRPEGRILLLEHVRPRSRLLGRFADLATVFTRRLFGFRANRHTEENLAAAGLTITEIRRSGIWREIEARPPLAEPRSAPRLPTP